MTEKRFSLIDDYKISYDGDVFDLHKPSNIRSLVTVLGYVTNENEQLKNKIDVLEDDNETYHKSLEKLNLYTNRFIPTKCTNEFKDCKTNRYYWLDHEGNFEGCLELLNLLDCEKELLESENRHLKGRLMLYEKSDLDYVEMEIDKELYSKLKEKYEFFDNISLSFDEYLNYLIQVGLDND